MMVVMACAFMGLVIIFVLILFDNKVRGKEEVDAICNKACVAALNNKKERATAIIKVQHLLSENVEDKLVMATLNNGKAFDKVCEVLNEAITGQVTFADNICKNAEGLFTCSNKKRVILIVEQDRDTVGELREAMKNLELVNAALIGYILV
jgi:acyl-CoA reductase-like NAD-dependent aldehyde dehydrogenase